MASGVVVDFAGFPARSLERYLDILVNRLNCRVALCEQQVTKQDGAPSIRRHVTRVITPGTVIEERFLDAASYNYLLAVNALQDDKDTLGLAWMDVSVGEFVMQLSHVDTFKDDLARIRPREVILPESIRPSEAALMEMLAEDTNHHPVLRPLLTNPSVSITYQPDSSFDETFGATALKQMFANDAVEIYGTSDSTQLLGDYHVFSEAEKAASAALFHYVEETHPEKRPRLQKPTRYDAKDTLLIDSAAMASLEIVRTLKDNRRKNSLLSIIDYTVTSAGSRLLANWLCSPLTSASAIKRRQDVVDFFAKCPDVLHDLRHSLQQTTDAQRTLQRIAVKRYQYSDLLQIASTLEASKSIQTLIQNALQSNRKQFSKRLVAAVTGYAHSLDPHEDLAKIINFSFIEHAEPDDNQKEKLYGFVNPAIPEMQQLYTRLSHLNEERDKLQIELRTLCGNSVSLLNNGLYKHVVEINASQAQKLLNAYTEATLINSTKTKHRYQLKAWTDLSIQLETTLAEIVELETRILEDVAAQVLNHSTTIIRNCQILAQLDVLSAFAWLSKQYNYVRPKITHDNTMDIKEGRHPVVETTLATKGVPFVKNDCLLGQDQRLWLLTGPNMGGKSTFLRQNALIILLAQVGCFVPAKSATIGIADRLYSRVGAADNLAEGLSTFMVEMTETANILKHATSRSVVIMDEIGRGTSTTDGLSLAYAILLYLHNHSKSRTLFATHYHELADLVSTDQFHMLRCFQTSLQEDSFGGFAFIHKIKPGVCRQSHGLKVAQLAGM